MVLSAASDGHLYRELEATLAQQRKLLLRDPVTLARGLDAKYVARGHLRVIARAFVEMSQGQYDRIAICTPPQVGKTTTASEWSVFWWLCLHPDHKVIIASYSASIAVRRSRKVRQLVRDFGAEFGLVMDPENGQVDDWRLLSGGGVKAAGLSGSINGSPGDAVVIDDPMKGRAEAESPTARETVYDVYSGDLLSRLAPGAPLMAVGTLWHPDDLISRITREEGVLEDGGDWRLIKMPAMCTDPETDPLGRALGDPLPHPKLPEGDREALLRHWERKRRTSKVRDWFSLYQCDPKPVEGALLTREQIRAQRCYRPDVVPVRIGVFVDPAGGGRDEAGILGAYMANDGRLYFTHDRTTVSKSAVWSRAACELAAETKAAFIVVENNFGGDQTELVLSTAWDALKHEYAEQHPGQPNPYAFKPRVAGMGVKTGKITRAEPISQQFLEDKIRIAAPMPELEDEWATYQQGSPNSPGRLDASVLAGYSLLTVPGAEAHVSAAGINAGAPPVTDEGMPGTARIITTDSGVEIHDLGI